MAAPLGIALPCPCAAAGKKASSSKDSRYLIRLVILGKETDVILLVAVELARRNLITPRVVPTLRVEIVTESGILETTTVTGIDRVQQDANLSAIAILYVIIVGITTGKPVVLGSPYGIAG
jgi:hypothetical protein